MKLTLIVLVINFVTLASSKIIIPKVTLGRVAGGVEADPYQFPYIVAIHGKQLCAGSILTENKILTAAFCCESQSAEDITVQYGSIDWKTGGEEGKVQSISIHPEYNQNSNMLCVLTLTSRITFGDTVGPIALAQGRVNCGDAVLAGWGSIGAREGGLNDLPSPVLRWVNLPLLSVKQCIELYPDGGIGKNDICTSGSDEKGSCKGDEGGPLTLDGKQIGIIAPTRDSDFQCGAGYVNVHVRISAYYDWIQEQL